MFFQTSAPSAPRPASFLHADLDSFYASVEQRDDCRLRGRPVAVGGGIILAASYEAKRLGVYAPMPEFRARRLCPDLTVVPPRFDAYSAASAAVFEIFRNTTPLVEGISIDEAFLDVSGLRRVSGRPAQIARQLRAAVRDEVGLPISVGVASTKFLAKVASAAAKPDGLLVVAAGGELEFLHPLPVEALWGVGPVTRRRLNERGVRLIGDLALLSELQLRAIVGAAAGRHLHALAHNRDPRPIEIARRRRSIGSQTALGRRPRTPDEIEALLLAIVDRVSRRLRAAGRAGRCVSVRVRFHDFSAATRSHMLAHPTCATATIAEVASALLDRHRSAIDERGVSLLAVAVGDLSDSDQVKACEQLELPLDGRRTSSLDRAVDGLMQRYGTHAVRRASTLRQPAGFEVPKLPD